MPKKVILLIALALFLASANGQNREGERLFSPGIAEVFVNLADNNQQNTEMAILFLNASRQLTGYSPQTNKKLIDLISESPVNRTVMMESLLQEYVTSDADLRTAKKGIRYLLRYRNTREQREELLRNLILRFQNKNDWLVSDLYTQLGFLAEEKADLETAFNFFWRAYSTNPYNQLAFDKIRHLNPDAVQTITYVQQLRRNLILNPYDIRTALTFAGIVEQLRNYDIAASSYEYTAQLYRHLAGEKDINLPDYIYLPWMLSLYNSNNPREAVDLANQVRDSENFDLFLEAIAAKAAQRSGDIASAERMLAGAAEKAEQLYESNKDAELAQKLGWFYSFALPKPDMAIDWANKAYSVNPDSPEAASILAYSLVENGNSQWAKALLEDIESRQLKNLTMAKINIEADQNEQAVELLKEVIAQDPGSLEAETARMLLEQIGSKYTPDFDPAIIRTVLRNEFGRNYVPNFTKPEDTIQIGISMRGDKFGYGSNFGASIYLTNRSADPIVIGENSFLKGRIRLDAKLTGDIEMHLPGLMEFEFQPSSPIRSQASHHIPLEIGSTLWDTLRKHPQASIDIEFTLYFDPIRNEKDELVNGIAGTEPIVHKLKRTKVTLTGRYLQNRLDSLSRGSDAQKIDICRLFTGILLEQHSLAQQKVSYNISYANWMPRLLKSALADAITTSSWTTKGQIMAYLMDLPLDITLVEAISSNLNDPQWPIRMLSIYLLKFNSDSDFDRVINWAAQHDSNSYVREMCVLMAAEKE